MLPITPSQIDPLFSAYDHPDSPGCVLAVIQESQITYQRGYGMADLERCVPLSSDSVFDIASTGKQFTAFVALALSMQGKVDLEAPLRQYLPELHACCDPLKVRQLLHHTSGIRDYCTLMELAGMPLENKYSEGAIFDLIARQRLLCHQPGEEFLYSNSGYFLFNRIIERIGGRKLLDLIREWIFEPLGMKHSTFNDNFGRIVPKRALAYDPVEAGGFRTNISFCGGFGDGPVLTTVGDLYLWDQNFYHNCLCGGGQKIVEQMQTSGVLNNSEATDYGWGLYSSTQRGLRMVSHSGSWAGYRSQFIRFPEQRFSVIVLANLSTVDPSKLALQVADLYLSEKYPEPATTRILPTLPAVPITNLDEWTGFFRDLRTGCLLELAVEADTLVLVVEGDRILLVQTSSLTFQNIDQSFGDWVVLLEPGTASRNPSIVINMDVEKPERFTMLAMPDTMTAQDLAEYCGVYYSSELDITYQLLYEGGQLLVKPGYAPPEPMRPAARNHFICKQTDIHFEWGGKGQPDKFWLSAGRLRELEFIRVAQETITSK